MISLREFDSEAASNNAQRRSRRPCIESCTASRVNAADGSGSRSLLVAQIQLSPYGGFIALQLQLLLKPDYSIALSTLSPSTFNFERVPHRPIPLDRGGRGGARGGHHHVQNFTGRPLGGSRRAQRVVLHRQILAGAYRCFSRNWQEDQGRAQASSRHC